MRRVYLKRRLSILAVLLALVALTAITLSISSFSPASTLDDKGGLNGEPDAVPKTPVPIFEKESEESPSVEAVANETEEESCETVPGFEDLGCLEENNGSTIFEAYGMRPSDDNVKDVIRVVEKECRTDPPDRECIVDKALYESENSWACEWKCLEDMASCPTYKTHLAVAVLRQYVPATDAFVGRTKDYDFFMIYKSDPDDNDSWTSPIYLPVRDIRDTETLYNDIYHVGPMDEIVFPEIKHVEPGDDFCFEFESNKSCFCKVNIGGFTVGECPELPADLRGICDAPTTDVSIKKGSNRICFKVDENADSELYTYRFELGGSSDYWFAGNALIPIEKHACCVNKVFEGFLEVT